MALNLEWLLPMVEQFWPEGEQKAERSLQFLTKKRINNKRADLLFREMYSFQTTSLKNQLWH